MADWLDYKGIDVPDATPTGAGGLNLKGDLTELADRAPNLSTSDPTANDDTNDGYFAGSTWFNTTSETMWVCTDATASAAVWKSLYKRTAGAIVLAPDVDGSVQIDNLQLDGNTLSSTNTNGDVTVTPDGTGNVILDGLKWPNADGTSDQILKTDGAGNLSWTSGAGGLNYWNDSTGTYNTVEWAKLVPDSALGTNVAAILSPKGNRGIQTQVADGTATGGNNRGTYSVDLQTLRSAATEVASASNSVICGGERNTSSATHSTICGGQKNTASGAHSSVLGGYGNIAEGTYSVALGRRAKTGANNGVFIFADSTNADFTAPAADTFCVRASGGLQLVDGNETNGYVLTSDANGVGTWQATADAGGTIQGTDTHTYNIRSTNEGTAAGNARGEHSVDLQTKRAAAYQVASGAYSVVAGGIDNVASGAKSTISGGRKNRATNTYSTAVGGFNNRATGYMSAILGGSSNQAATSTSVVCGGSSNDVTSSGSNGFVGGGKDNQVTGSTSAIVGGESNICSGQNSFIGGGGSSTAASGNHNYATYSVIGGGKNNDILASRNYSVIGGGDDNEIKTSGTRGFIGGGKGNDVENSYASVCGGKTNKASGNRSFVGGGINNTSSGLGCFTGGGGGNTGSANYSSIPGGLFNTVSRNYGAICGGHSNEIKTVGTHGFIGGGQSNDVTASHAVISGGTTNVASGDKSVVVGGGNNTASGAYSVAQGYRSVASLHGQSAHAAGRFSADGDAQSTRAILRRNTTNATSTELTLDGGTPTAGNRLVVDDEHAYSCVVRIAARRDTGSDQALFIRQVIIERTGGTVALEGTVQTIGTDINPGSWSISITADDTNKSLKVDVTGAASTNIRWVAVVEAIEIEYAD